MSILDCLCIVYQANDIHSVELEVRVQKAWTHSLNAFGFVNYGVCPSALERFYLLLFYRWFVPTNECLFSVFHYVHAIHPNVAISHTDNET